MNTKSSFVLNRMLKTPIKLNLDGILSLSILQIVVAILNILNIEFCRRLLNDLLSHDMGLMKIHCVIFICVMVIILIMEHVNNFMVSHVRGKIILDMTDELMRKNARLCTWSNGELSTNDRISVVNGDCERYADSLMNKAYLFSSLVTIPCYVVYGMTINIWITLLIISAGIILSIGNKNNKRKLYQYNEELNEKYGIWTNYLWKALDNLEVIRVFLSKSKIISEHRKRNDDYCETNQKSLEALMKVLLVEETSDMMFTLVILSMSFLSMIIGFMQPANIPAMIQALSTVQKKIFVLPEQIIQLNELESIASRITKFEQMAEDKGELELNEGLRSLNLKNLSIKYDDHEIINNIDFSFKKGKFYVVAGASGCGKSTLLKALARLIPISDGCVLWNDQDLSLVDRRSYFKRTDYIGQDHDFIEGTIQENIVTGNMNDAEYIKALKESGLSEVFDKNNITDEMIVYQSGYPLSSGERQMLAFAGVLYDNKELILLDESFSAVDPGKEKTFYERLKKCAGNGATVIMVSHRQTNFDIPDEIVYMDHGCILESGSFEKLCDSQGFFQSWINCDGAGEAEC